MIEVRDSDHSFMILHWRDFWSGYPIMGSGYNDVLVMILPPGGFLMLGFILLFFNWLQQRKSAPRPGTLKEAA